MIKEASNMFVHVPDPLNPDLPHWRKHLIAVDPARPADAALQGPTVEAGSAVDLPAGSYLLGYDAAGSHHIWYPVIRVWQVGPDGGLTQVYRYAGDLEQTDWPQACLAALAALVADPANPQP
jgi:hypothetical protein